MAKLHVIFGIITFVIFALTGKFMRWDFPDKEIIPAELRILMRSRHIYLLFSALIHLVLGAYLNISARILPKSLQVSGSLLLCVGSVFLFAGFVYDTYYAKTFSDVARFGIYLSLGGATLHLFGGLLLRNER